MKINHVIKYRMQPGELVRKSSSIEGFTNEAGIAVVGMSCLFPGANDLSQLWYNIVNGVNVFIGATHEYTHDTHRGVSDPDGDPFSTSLRIGPKRFSVPLYPAIYGLTTDDLKAGNRDQILLILIAAALYDAGISPNNEIRNRTDIIIAQSRPGEGWRPFPMSIKKIETYS
ncbi:beta-ketoacyl synthase N-terminal-like domain-containing protein, partial [Thermodesulfobacteriota bacterium]